MALNNSGPISIGGSTAGQSINLEFGRTATQQTSMSQLYRNGGIVGGGNTNVPTSGAISLSQFYGASNGFTFNATISSNTTNYNLRSAAIAAGWDGTTTLIATVTINSGVTVYSTSTGTPAFQTGSPFPSGSSLSLVNNGTILGKGGNGGAGGGSSLPTGGSSGGPGLTASAAISITNNNRIAGGGGGGGGGGFQNYEQSENLFRSGGGGGGGGIGSGAGGSRGTGVASPGSDGGSGTLTSPGGGGSGGANGGGAGGSGGSYGAAGSSGTSTSSVTAAGGGSAGAAVTGNSNITWVATGTRNGAIS